MQLCFSVFEVYLTIYIHFFPKVFLYLFTFSMNVKNVGDVMIWREGDRQKKCGLIGKGEVKAARPLFQDV